MSESNTGAAGEAPVKDESAADRATPAGQLPSDRLPSDRLPSDQLPDGGLPPDRLPIGPLQLFISFSLLTISGFGGVLPFAYRMLVEKRQWVDKKAFAELFALAQMMPGPPILHIAQMVGHRESGWRGGVAAVLGIIVLPTLLMMVLGLAYQYFIDIAAFRKALAGMSAAAVSLILVMGIKLATAVPRRVRPWTVVVLAFVLLGLLHVSFFIVMAFLLPLSMWFAWKEPG